MQHIIGHEKIQVAENIDTGCRKYMPTCSNVGPCALFIVIAKYGSNGNCVRRKATESFSISEGSNGIIGRNTLSQR